jgi:phosphate starvation-inducible protein PhoH and related proteins
MIFQKELYFENNKILPLVFGVENHVLTQLEKELSVDIHAKGGEVFIQGQNQESVNRAEKALQSLYDRVLKYGFQDEQEVRGIVNMTEQKEGNGHKEGNGTVSGTSSDDLTIVTKKKVLRPYSLTQAEYMRSLKHNDITFAVGPAGTGKTYIAVAEAVSMLLSGALERIILTRPAIEAGEHLGFLPGDLKEKVDPYLRPIYDALYDMMPTDQVARYLESGQIEIAPLAFMRGRTLSSAFIILDEAQNTTPIQMKMFLTRLGDHSKMVITGDLTQVDLASGVKSGLRDAVEILRGIEGISFIHLTEADVVRHPLVKSIVRAYADFYNV